MSEKVKNKIPMSEHWFWGSFIDSKATYIQITLASIFINIFINFIYVKRKYKIKKLTATNI